MGDPARLGVFGGTFDPPHLGHLVTAVNVRHALDLDEVLLVVAGEPWQKVGVRDVSAAEDRLAMVESCVAAVPGLSASDLEVGRPGPSYTADTLALLSDRYPEAELFVILGRDAAEAIESWERLDSIRTAATFVVVDRPGTTPGPLADGICWIRVEVPALDVSSTDLRARVRDGRPLDFLVPDSVVATIEARGLYRAGSR